MSPWLMHLPVVPVLVPFFAAALMLLFSRRRTRVAIALAATSMQLVVAVLCLYLTTDHVPEVWPEGIGVYSIGAWPAPFGIVLVVDRLSALMLVLLATLALPTLVYSLARWERAGVNYHPLLQLLLMGLAGAFLTGDLFNLFVFFEVTLAASYGLLLHGSGAPRVKAGLHYVVVNLVASLLFLTGVALVYAVTGTLNMADVGAQATQLVPRDRGLFEAGVALLGVAFLVKAACWPLNFWLPGAYPAAYAPVAAVFAILTKLGIYAVLRVGSLLGDIEVHGPLAAGWLLYGGVATMLFGVLGMLASQRLARLVAFSVIVSTGTVLAAVGFDGPAMTAAALYYLASSVLATGAFFMLTGMTDRTRAPELAHVPEDSPLPPASAATFVGVEERHELRDGEDEPGVAIPAAMAFLGLMFVGCALLVTGLPPLSGFVAKFALLSNAIGSAAAGASPTATIALVASLLVTSLAALVALTRVGMRLFWSVAGRATPRLRVIEAGPVACLVLLCVVLTAAAGPVMSYLDAAAQSLYSPDTYVRAVLSAHATGPPGSEVEP